MLVALALDFAFFFLSFLKNKSLALFNSSKRKKKTQEFNVFVLYHLGVSSISKVAFHVVLSEAV